MKVYVKIVGKLSLVTDDIRKKVKFLPDQNKHIVELNPMYRILSGLSRIKNDNFFVVIEGCLSIQEDHYHYESGNLLINLLVKMPEETKFTINIDGIFGGSVWKKGHYISTIDEEKKYFEKIIQEILQEFQDSFKEIETQYLKTKLIMAQLENIKKTS